MLKNIAINDFTIIDQLDLDLRKGMTAVTGETGAGKSIIIDALQLALGARADHSVIRSGCERANITASFAIENIPAARRWLQQHEVDADHECILRRTINANGGSKHYVNGHACTQTQLRELGDLLLNIHGQHANQQLYKRDNQQQLLDEFALSMGLNKTTNQAKLLDQFGQHETLLNKVKSLYKQYTQIKNEINQLASTQTDQSAKIELLHYQTQELEQLDMQPDEWPRLTQEHKQLANAEQIITDCQQAFLCLSHTDEPKAEELLQQAQSLLSKYQQLDPRLQTSVELLNQALIQCQEARNELQSYVDAIEVNPERLAEVEQRLTRIHELARKHHVEPSQLTALLTNLQTKLERIQHADQRVQILEKELLTIEQEYQQMALQLTASRQAAATQLERLVTHHIQQLGMPHGQFAIQFTPLSTINSSGAEKIEFLVNANPGQPLQSLAKVASGGEVSRISLAIQVVTAQAENTPTMIFDEVDVGIGGGTAEIVGKLLRDLGKKTQVLCITHLPQVASQADHHLRVSKNSDSKTTTSQIDFLSAEQRIQEVARMLGGVKITEHTLAHAEEMLQH